MNWAAFALVVGYISVCEYRAPNPWAACDARWNVALAVFVPSPLQGAIPAAGRLLGLDRRRRPEVQHLINGQRVLQAPIGAGEELHPVARAAGGPDTDVEPKP